MCLSRLPAIWPHRADLDRLDGEPSGRAGHLRLLFGGAGSLPGGENTALGEQRGGELGDRREAAHGPGGDRVVGLAPLPRRPVLGALADDARRWRVPFARSPRARNSHLRPTDSIRSKRAPGRQAASTRPGRPAPLPRSAIRFAERERLDLQGR